MKRPTIKDVAREANVSPATVSHALNGHKDVNEETRRRIQEIARRLDYVPNTSGRALGGMPAKTLALMLVDNLYPTDPSGLTYGLLSGMFSVAQKVGFDFEIISAPAKKQAEVSFLTLCRQKGVTAVFVQGLAMDMPYYRQIAETHIPCASLDVGFEDSAVRVIEVDNLRASREMTRHLIERGYRNIAHIGGKATTQVAYLRRDGYLQALAEAGLPARTEWIVDGGFLPEPAEAAALELKRRHPEIDAFFCASDRMAVGTIRAMEKLGVRVPEDVGIAGFDDIPISRYYHGGITSVAQHPFELGRLGAETLLALLEKRDVPARVESHYELMLRHSTEHN